MDKKIITIGLAGNPNTGKTAVFNALSGARQKTGNYPGVTVEKKEATKIYKDYTFRIFDMPGTYSLSAYSIDEVIARDFILDEKPDIIIDVVDSTNFSRNMYLLLEFKELNVPMVCVLNMSDQAESMGISIDEKTLSELISMPVVKTVGSKGKNVNAILDAAIEVFETNNKVYGEKDSKTNYDSTIENEVVKIASILDENKESKYSTRWLAIKLLEKDPNANEKIQDLSNKDTLSSEVDKSIKVLEEHYKIDSEIILSEQKYAYINGLSKEVVVQSVQSKQTITEKIDKIFINRVLGLPIFLGIMWLVFQITFTVGAYPQGWLETFFGIVANIVSSFLPADSFLQSIIVDGIIGGLGAVLSFVPLIIILFLCLVFLEDIGYMSRAAFMVDKFLHIFGLHGQSFFPLMLGFGCSIPAIMAARTLKSRKDQIITILAVPFMSCGAKLPVHILLAGAFFPDNPGNVVMIMYIIGVVVALIASKIISRILGKKSTPFVMELPLYRMPTVKAILLNVWAKTKSYLKRAGTVLLLAAIIVWAITVFPQMSEEQTNIVTDEATKSYLAENPNASDEELEEYISLAVDNAAISQSLAGTLGRVIEPVVKPLGFDWRIGISVVTGFAAKEVVVSTLGIIYNISDPEEGGNADLQEILRKAPNFNALIAVVLMLVTLFMTPCVAAIAVVKGELGWKWFAFYIVYSLAFAWIVGTLVYQIGSLIEPSFRVF